MVDLFPQIFVFKSAISKSIDFNNGTITTARVKLTWTGLGTPTLYLTANGGSNLENVGTLTNASQLTHTFSNTGTDLRWKIEGSGFTVTQLVLDNYH